ncbi:putative tetratricopeptide-like helical [Rosellinia necatrix]|uniref:Putative tetratricopeptide-like helical n=1 Tax=Rosellinia necatrix TaxID=77044 RepID=A0A1S7UK96_ROSNE|nr:putative tetratricopeptide-like helical [Rosellinia necatrix]
MEVIGLVAAIPGLIEITRKTISVTRELANQKSFLKKITELLDLLGFIERILQDVLNRLKPSDAHHTNLSYLNTVVQSLEGELISLHDLLQPLAAGPNRIAKALKRARLLIPGLEKKIDRYHERLEKASSLLATAITAQGRDIVEETLLISRSNMLLKLNDVLLPCEHSFIPPNLQGTCEWIWSHPAFCQWQRDPTGSAPVVNKDQIVCIYGQKGCGKSVLAASIANKLNSPTNLAVGFSFWAGSQNQQKLIAFLRTLLWHLIQRLPDDKVSQLSKLLLESLPFTENSLEDLVSLAAKTMKSRVYCVVDGIDESVDDWSRPDTGGLRLVLGLARRHANLRIALLGRDASMRSATSLIPLRIEITEELIRPDINRFIMHHLDSSLKIPDPGTRQLIQDTLQENSRVMFLWVSLIFGELNRCQLRRDVALALQQIPQDLDREYHRLFLRLQDRLGGRRNRPSLSMERARCLLSWIIAAPEPLTYEELRCAFAISQCPNTEYDQYLLSEEGIMDTCGDFIRVSDGRYHMIHASIAEFLTRSTELWQDEDRVIDYFRIDVLHSQSQMCLECITYFQRIDLGYPLVEASTAMACACLPIFSCALKFALGYIARTYESEHHKRVVWERIEEFMTTPRFYSLVEYGWLIFQNEPDPSSDQYKEILDFISWMGIEESLDRFTILSLIGTRFQQELARRETVFGLDDPRCRTWRSLVGAFMATPESGLASGLSHVTGSIQAEGTELTELAPNNNANRTRQASNGDVGRATEHTAILKVGENLAADVHVSRILSRAVPDFTMIIPKLLPVPVLIFLASRQTDREREEQYLSSALERLTGADSFLEAYCAMRLAMCRFGRGEALEIVEGLLNRCRQIAMKLSPSLHVDMLLCSTLKYLSRALMYHGEGSEAKLTKMQGIYGELQQRLSVGPTKGYLSTRLERKLYLPLFWGGWEAEVLAKVANYHTWAQGATYNMKAVSIVDSDIRLHSKSGRVRVKASVIAHKAKSWALFRQWDESGGEIGCELARRCEAACWETLRSAKFPNLVKYRAQQWSPLISYPPNAATMLSLLRQLGQAWGVSRPQRLYSSRPGRSYHMHRYSPCHTSNPNTSPI